MQDLIKKSGAAQCGVMERETVVKSVNLKKAINVIKKSGTHQFIGSGPGLSMNTKKVWFIRRGGF